MQGLRPKTAAGAGPLIALLSLRSVVMGAGCQQGLDFIDLVGGNSGLRQPNATGPSACCNACGSTSGCLGFAWVHAHGKPVPGISAAPGCWLKLSGTPWQERTHVARWGNRAVDSTVAGANPLGPGLEAFYVVVGGDCSSPGSCNATECAAESCTDCAGGAIHAPLGGDMGDCPPSGNLLSRQNCSLSCPTGSFANGTQPQCKDGALLVHIRCERCADCAGIRPPVHGGMGDCLVNGTLPSGTSCTQRCEPNYAIAGEQATYPISPPQIVCTCGGSVAPTLNTVSITCEKCLAGLCSNWYIFTTVSALVGGSLCLLWLRYYFKKHRTFSRENVRKAWASVSTRCNDFRYYARGVCNRFAERAKRCIRKRRRTARRVQHDTGSLAP